MRILNLSGSAYEMGVQHGRQVVDLRQIILNNLEDRLDYIGDFSGAIQAEIEALAGQWEEINQPTVAMMRGISRSLDFDWDQYFLYTIRTYLEDRLKIRTLPDGCTTWAAGGEYTTLGEPLLAKNRDFRPVHLSLQCLAWATPDVGYPYLYITSAGSPAVYSSGMNAAGLAVVDSYVASTDLGPGIPRYSAMMHVLQHCASVPEALDYLVSVPHMGNGNLLLLDAGSQMAAFEAGHRRTSIIRSRSGVLASTNHFVSSRLRDYCEDRYPQSLRGNSKGRRTHVRYALMRNRGRISMGWAQQLMSSHGSPLKAVCRHPEQEPESVTISTVFYLPQSRQVVIGEGLPCGATFETYSL